VVPLLLPPAGAVVVAGFVVVTGAFGTPAATQLLYDIHAPPAAPQLICPFLHFGGSFAALLLISCCCWTKRTVRGRSNRRRIPAMRIAGLNFFFGFPDATSGGGAGGAGSCGTLISGEASTGTDASGLSSSGAGGTTRESDGIGAGIIGSGSVGGVSGRGSGTVIAGSAGGVELACVFVCAASKISAIIITKPIDPNSRLG